MGDQKNLFLLSHLRSNSRDKNTINADLVNYFDNYMISLSNSTLNSFAKGVINPKF